MYLCGPSLLVFICSPLITINVALTLWHETYYWTNHSEQSRWDWPNACRPAVRPDLRPHHRQKRLQSARQRKWRPLQRGESWAWMSTTEETECTCQPSTTSPRLTRRMVYNPHAYVWRYLNETDMPWCNRTKRRAYLLLKHNSQFLSCELQTNEIHSSK